MILLVLVAGLGLVLWGVVCLIGAALQGGRAGVRQWVEEFRRAWRS